MGCRYEWADDSHFIMNLYIEAPWTWEEYNNVVQEMTPLLRDTGKPCATIVDISRMGSMPQGNVLSNLTNMEKTMPDNVFASALVGAPYIAMTFLDILMRIRPRAKRTAIFTKTMVEAQQKIQQRYEQLSIPSEKKTD
jgi:hypothetical protein